MLPVRPLLLFLLIWSAAGATGQRPPRQPDIFFAPTREPVVYEMLELARVTADDVIYDLGSGDGRIVVLAAQKYGTRGVGIELDPKLVASSRQVARDIGLDHKVTFVEGDFWTADISAATIVTLYLSPTINRDLEPKLRRELRPGTRIVSHQFPIGRWVPDRVVRSREDGTDLFLWTVPASKQE
jgi:SAM-dependent methyltransferase